MYAKRPSPGRERAPARAAGGAWRRWRGLKVIKKANKGARGMPVALGGEEGRDKLRKAAVRGTRLACAGITFAGH